MSRTFRRLVPRLIDDYCGRINNIDERDLIRYRASSPKHAMARKFHRFTRDRRRGLFGVPRWYRRLHFTKPGRAIDTTEIRRCLLQGSFDDHLVRREPRSAWFRYHW